MREGSENDEGATSGATGPGTRGTKPSGRTQ